MGIAVTRARRLRRDQTEAERRLWSRLRGPQVDGVQFRCQRPPGPCIVDFVCLSHRVVVELDGSQHADQEAYDDERTKWLKEQGFRVMRFWNDIALRETDGVIAAIQDALSAR